MTAPDAPSTKFASLILECELDEPIDKVWRALSEPQLLAQWLVPDGAVAGDGATFKLAGAVTCEILESDPPRRLRFHWQASEPKANGTVETLDTIVTFELEPIDDRRTHLRLVHDGFVVPADYRFDGKAEEPECLVLLPLDAIARRRIPKPRPAALARRALPTIMRLAA